MKLSDTEKLQGVEIRSIGRHWLVSEKDLPTLCNKVALSSLKIPDKITISFLLKYYRFIIHNLSRKGLADRAGVTPNQVSDIENGKKSPQKKTIQKLGKILGDDFLCLASQLVGQKKS